METFKKGDAKGMEDLYTEEGQLLPPKGHTITGRNAISEFWQAVMDMGITSVKIETGEVENQGDTAIEISKANLYGENDHLLDEVKYIIIWKKVNGERKLHRDIFNSNRVVK